ncbi:MAG TPA: ATP-binding protein [Verrucomicrobiae bacterium]|nr:ATP-binding protein [Verrucomicrobiae bacterium]
MNTRSLRFRLIAWYAGLLIVVFLILGGVVYGGLKSYLEHSLADSQMRRAKQVAYTLIAHIDQTGPAHVVNEINSWFAPETSDRFIRITQATGTVVYQSANPKDQIFDASHVPFPHQFAKATWRKESVPDGKQLLIASFPYQTSAGKKYVVEVGVSMEPVQNVLQRLVTLLAFGLTAMVVVAIGGGYLLVRRALSPVDRIAASAAHISLHNLKQRLPVEKTGDELERLSVSLNQMIARLEDAVQQNQRFIADASHELRTPLTIMRGELEAMVEGAYLASDAQETAASILEEVERLGRIVEGLFAISRLDAGEAQKQSAPFDLAALAISTAEQMCLLAEDKGISISTDAPHEVIVEGDRSRLKQVVVNLLDNAIKYTPEGGKIRLSVLTRDDTAVLSVEDNGIGVPVEAQAHIFERFFRVDKARSRELGGAGLGLSIVKSICAAHGGQVEVRSADGQGSRFTVELPLAHMAGKKEAKHGN